MFFATVLAIGGLILFSLFLTQLFWRVFFPVVDNLTLNLREKEGERETVASLRSYDPNGPTDPQSKTELMLYLTNRNIVKSKLLMSGLLKIDLGDFSNEKIINPYADEEVIVDGVFRPSPSLLVQSVDLGCEEIPQNGRILIDGCGSGYQMGLLAYVAGRKNADCVCLSQSIDAARVASTALAKVDRKIADSITFCMNPSNEIKRGLFDCIFCLMAQEQVPTFLFSFLKESGTLFVPIGRHGNHKFGRVKKIKKGKGKMEKGEKEKEKRGDPKKREEEFDEEDEEDDFQFEYLFTGHFPLFS